LRQFTFCRQKKRLESICRLRVAKSAMLFYKGFAEFRACGRGRIGIVDRRDLRAAINSSRAASVEP